MKNEFRFDGIRSIVVLTTPTYNLVSSDKKYHSFTVSVQDTITISDGTTNISINVSPNEEIVLNDNIVSITSTVDNDIRFLGRLDGIKKDY